MSRFNNLRMFNIAKACPVSLLALSALSGFCPLRSLAAAPAASAASVIVATKRDGDTTHFYVTNFEFSEVTMTFAMKLINLKSCADFPYTVTLPARQATEVFSLTPNDPGKRWEFDYTNYYKLGSATAQPDESFAYQLPFAPGAKFKVTQGYNGAFSHTGANQYAIDWKMPEGTPVRAARGGVVVKVKDDSDTGGPSMDYDRFNNYVLIRHDDGTLAHYCHLQKGGCVVKPGQIVETGQLIAHSGSTGFSSGPHLHFCVFKTRNGRERVSIPTKFQTATESAVTLLEGHSYRAAGLSAGVSVAAFTKAGQSQGGASLQ